MQKKNEEREKASKKNGALEQAIEGKTLRIENHLHGDGKVCVFVDSITLHFSLVHYHSLYLSVSVALVDFVNSSSRSSENVNKCVRSKLALSRLI